MPRRAFGRILATSILVVLLARPWSSAAGDEHAGQAAVNSRQENKVKEDPFDVPEGTIEELQKYIEGLNKIQPSSSLRPANAELRKKRAAAQRMACEKILASNPTPDQAQAAVRVKIAAIALLGRLGDETAPAALEATIEQVKKLGLKDVLRTAQLAVLEYRGERAAAMSDQDYGAFVERLKGFLESGPSDAAAAKLAVNVALAAEQSNRPALAVKSYVELGKVLAANKDGEIAATAAPMLGAARRLELVGKSFVLDGSTLAGKPLDWKKYRGKVVLVDFFETSCGPHREEIPEILKCYRAYRKRGFDVVGVSIDRDRKAIEEFLEREKQPWTVLLDRNEARGSDKSMATYYGIFTVPQMILVGKDGKVLASNVRGRQLGKKLEELLGPANQ